MKPSRPRSRSPAVGDAPGGLRIPIDELARRTGVTVRNLRELTTRGLLDSPLLEGRKGFYSERHLARVALVRRLQDRGYSLASIADLLGQWEGGGDLTGALERAVMTPAAGEQEPMPGAELLGQLPELARDAKLLALAREVEFVAGEGDEMFAPSAELVHIARTFIDGGVPLGALLTELQELRKDAERIAARFREMFQRSVMDELQRKALPTDSMARLAERIAVLRPAGVRATTIVLAQVVERGGPASAPKPTGSKARGT